MKFDHIGNMNRGWFIGNFEPSLFKTDDCEVCVKHYKGGDSEPKHMHKIATETTVIISGMVQMNGQTYGPGDIIVMEPGEATDFKALTDACNVVVKLPCVKGDKYIVEDSPQG